MLRMTIRDQRLAAAASFVFECSDGNRSVAETGTQGAAGTWRENVIIVNLSGQRCSLFGYATVRLLGVGKISLGRDCSRHGLLKSRPPLSKSYSRTPEHGFVHGVL